MRRILMLMLGVLLTAAQLFAQGRTITGRITDAQGSAVPNASVTVKGTSTGTSTNAEGNFSLNVPADAQTLVVSSVGFQNQEVAINGRTRIDITLSSVEKAMDEVVVVGYGTAKRVGSVVGDVATVNANKIKDKPTANAFDALQGKVAGLQVFTSSGEPSQTSSIRLHGVGSLGASSTPLYVMDGMPIDPGTVISLNPNDFESISVLKDASATSIYGSRAANGVIYITTKKGYTNRPAEIKLSAQYGISNLANTDYFENFMNTKELTDFWVATGYRTQAQIDALLAQYPNDTKWYKVYYKDNVPMQQYDLSVSGGAGRTSYYISGGYLNQPGLAYRSGFNRYTMRSNLNTTVNDWLKMGLMLFAGTDKRQTNPYGSNSTNRGLALLAAPFYTPYDSTGKEVYGLIPGWGRYAPKYLADKIQGTDNNVQFNPSAFIQLTPIKNLTLKTQAGIEAFDYRSSTVTLPSYIGSLNNGAAGESFTRGITRTITNTGEYKFRLSDVHNFTFLLGQEYNDYKNTSFSGSSQGQTDDRLILLNNGSSTKMSVSSGLSEYAYASYFSRLEYNFNSRYFVDGSFRQDQSSRFGKDNRTANFWSVGAMWKAKSEDFLRDINWLTDLTVKASTGTTGNSSIGNYQSLALVGTNAYDAGTGWQVSSAGNPDLSWEAQQNSSVGFSSRLFDRVSLDLSYYNRVTKNMLISVPYPYTSGFGSITSNVGSLKNSGIDMTLNADVIRSKKAILTPYVTLNYNKNEVTELFQGKQYWIIPNTGVSWAIGQPVSFFYPIFAGVNPTTGMPEWYQPNTNPDEIVNTRKDPAAVTTVWSPSALQQSTGIKRYPPFNGGFGANGGYGGFSASIDFSFSQGKYLINNDRYFFENPNQFPGFNQSKTVLNYWQKPGDVATFPKFGQQFTQFDSRLVEDASFVRLKSATLAYNLPSSLAGKTGFMKGARVYVTGRNLMTWTKYTGPDPEVDSNLTLGVNPNTKQYAFGVDLTF